MGPGTAGAWFGRCAKLSVSMPAKWCGDFVGEGSRALTAGLAGMMQKPVALKLLV